MDTHQEDVIPLSDDIIIKDEPVDEELCETVPPRPIIDSAFTILHGNAVMDSSCNKPKFNSEDQSCGPMDIIKYVEVVMEPTATENDVGTAGDKEKDNEYSKRRAKRCCDDVDVVVSDSALPMRKKLSSMKPSPASATLLDGIMYYCDHCRFTSKHKLGLKLHIESKHLKLEFPPNILQLGESLNKFSQSQTTSSDEIYLPNVDSKFPRSKYPHVTEESNLSSLNCQVKSKTDGKTQVALKNDPKSILLKSSTARSKFSKTPNVDDYRSTSPTEYADSDLKSCKPCTINSCKEILVIPKATLANFQNDCHGSSYEDSRHSLKPNRSPKGTLLKPVTKIRRQRKAISSRKSTPTKNVNTYSQSNPDDLYEDSSVDEIVTTPPHLELSKLKCPKAVLLKPMHRITSIASATGAIPVEVVSGTTLSESVDASKVILQNSKTSKKNPEGKPMCNKISISNDTSSRETKRFNTSGTNTPLRTTPNDNVIAKTCKSKFSPPSKSQYFTSKNTDSNEKTKLPCSMCDYEANRLGDLKKHIKSQHLGIKYQCHYCDHQLTDISSLNKHIEFKHVLAKYMCALCGFKARQINSLLNHGKTQHLLQNVVCDDAGEVVFQCPSVDCDYSVSNIDDFLEHFKKDHVELELPFDPDSSDSQVIREGIAHSCPHCSYSSGRKSDLRKHIKSQHLGIRYPCTHCSYQATELGSLRVHIKSQHLGYKYPCSFCEYEAKWVGDLKKHIKSQHLGIRYPCSYCDYRATEASGLNRHVKTKHSNMFESTDNEPQSVQAVQEENITDTDMGLKYLCHHCGRAFLKFDMLHEHIVSQHVNIEDSFFEGNG